MPNSLEKSLEKIEQLAHGSLLGRFVHDPIRYVSAIGYWRLIYPLAKRGRFAKAHTFFGAEMEVVLPSATEIYLFGAKTHDSEIRLARFLMKNLRPGDTFCDVGAHFGYFSLLASQLVGKAGQVLSFEASKSTFGILEKNTAPFPNITLWHRAASNEDKVLVFNEFPALFSEYNSLVLPKEGTKWLRQNPPQQIAVEGLRLSAFFEKNGTWPSMLKVDVEGAELQVMEGMADFLATKNPTIVMEYLLESSQNEAHRKAVSFAQKIGYQSFRIKNDGCVEPCSDIEKAMAAIGLDSDNIILSKGMPKSAHLPK